VIGEQCLGCRVKKIHSPAPIAANRRRSVSCFRRRKPTLEDCQENTIICHNVYFTAYVVTVVLIRKVTVSKGKNGCFFWLSNLKLNVITSAPTMSVTADPLSDAVHCDTIFLIVYGQEFDGQNIKSLQFQYVWYNVIMYTENTRIPTAHLK